MAGIESKAPIRRIRMGGHHHHLVCTNCGKTVEIESPSESWLKGISDKYGFTIERHTLEVFGLCEDCRKADK